MSSEPMCMGCGDYIYHGHVTCSTCLPRVLQKERNKILDTLDKYVKESIKICDEPHGKLSSKMKVKGMRVAFTNIESVIEQCRSDEGIKLLKESLGKDDVK